MKRLIFAFVILLIAIGIGYLIHLDAGYVLLAYRGWTVETSLWVALLIVIVVYVVLYILSRIYRHTRTLHHKVRSHRHKRREQKGRGYTTKGLIELAEGNWKKAEGLLTKSAKHTQRNKLINHLAAARAAHELEAYDRRDNHLREAHKSTKGSEVAVGLTQAQLQISGNQWEQALATLKHLHQIAPKHRHVLKLLKQVYTELHDWSSMLDILPDLRRYDIVDKEEEEAIAKCTYTELMDNAAKAQNHDALDKIWEQMPKALRLHPHICDTYVRHLIQRDQGDKAIAIIENALKKTWDIKLVHYYGIAKGTQDSHQLTTAEKWAKHHPQEPALLLCLARLCMRNQFWGKAKYYLDECLALAPSQQAYQEMGRVLEELNEQEKALDYYRKGLILTEKML